ncbi:MAG: phosphate:Na+ symporter [Hyphomicrobiaceae bacterium]|jgi:phosphate:Na+ symporter
MTVLYYGLEILGALGVFLYGLKVMSEGLQKAAGSSLRSILAKATDNRVMGTISGFLVTCAVQSSSATTVMVVAFCSSGLLNLSQSLGVIFGANIGTTTTAWLVSLLGFKVKIAEFAVPLIGIGFFSQFIKRWSTPHKLGQVLVGFGLLFLGLDLLKHAIPDVGNAPQVTAWLAQLEPDTVLGLVSAVLFGTVITVIVQSSSASMAITLTAAAKGYIDFPTACAIALGQNIGTTVTAALAAIGAPLVARRAALAHVLFNLIGSIWPVFLLAPFLAFVDSIVPGDPYGTGPQSLLVAIPTHIAAFHTTFNVLNTVVFLPLTTPFEKLIVRLMPHTLEEEENEHDLIYLTTAFGDTPELAITAASREVDRMARVTVKMLGRIRRALDASPEELPPLLEKIQADETATDVLEHKINEYLAQLVHGQLSTAATRQVLSLMSMINDLERIGDHGEKVAMLLGKLTQAPTGFSDEAMDEVREIAETAEANLAAMKKTILTPGRDPMPEGKERENLLNEMRERFRQAHMKRVSEGLCDPLSGIIFSDMLSSFEKMGDHSFNVVEAAAGIK